MSSKTRMRSNRSQDVCVEVQSGQDREVMQETSWPTGWRLWEDWDHLHPKP